MKILKIGNSSKCFLPNSGNPDFFPEYFYDLEEITVSFLISPASTQGISDVCGNEKYVLRCSQEENAAEVEVVKLCKTAL